MGRGEILGQEAAQERPKFLKQILLLPLFLEGSLIWDAHACAGEGCVIYYPFGVSSGFQILVSNVVMCKMSHVIALQRACCSCLSVSIRWGAVGTRPGESAGLPERGVRRPPRADSAIRSRGSGWT